MSDIQARLIRITRLDEAGEPTGDVFTSVGFVELTPDEPPAVVECFEPMPSKETLTSWTASFDMTWRARGTSGRRAHRRFVSYVSGQSYTRMRMNERKARGRTKRVHRRRQLRR